jgi:hypothetical protein
LSVSPCPCPCPKIHPRSAQGMTCFGGPEASTMTLHHITQAQIYSKIPKPKINPVPEQT